jgi:hypothetical protein
MGKEKGDTPQERVGTVYITDGRQDRRVRHMTTVQREDIKKGFIKGSTIRCNGSGEHRFDLA